jgi:hypothetical protein
MADTHVGDREVTATELCQRALWLWPRLDRRSLSRTRGRPGRVVLLVARRTALDPEAILGMLIMERSSRRPDPG